MTTQPPLGRNDLLASFYTLSGAPNGERARHSFDDRIRAASAAGYAAIGMTLFDVEASTADGRSLEDLATVAAGHGISVAEIETLGVSPVLTDTERMAARSMFEAGERLRARHANVVIARPPGTDIDLDAAAATFAELCDMAADHDLRVAFEFMPFMAVATIDQASAIVDRADRPNGGLVVDAYHFFRGGSRLADLEKVSADRFVTLQISDAVAEPATDLIVETRTARRVPGRGALPLESLLRAIDATGSDATIGVEILSDELRALPLDEAAATTAAATRELLRQARR
ncbi:sugar phosphate isomerase/epimerase family protein [Nocardia sp. alder85J]|uniref:sugar phosphate isomerase/epimerase family protein n=1 Tax=Nocardia sp. alder85J TaxID=2862949 RepID=UPI001CD1C72D|nr:sugar phosphate isomerase/epimerase [Nocardia sp. alder85J]MCX4095642.1 sugar phosphate isomerase/epimerase [Nocardia sp. alder85J]